MRLQMCRDAHVLRLLLLSLPLLPPPRRRAGPRLRAVGLASTRSACHGGIACLLDHVREELGVEFQSWSLKSNFILLPRLSELYHLATWVGIFRPFNVLYQLAMSKSDGVSHL